MTSSGAAFGGCNRSGGGTGSTRTCPVAVSLPLETVYSSSTGSDTRRVSVMRSVWCASTATLRPESSGTCTDCTTSTPPAGSVSFASTSTRVEPPAGSIPVSATTTGGPVASSGSCTSTRTTPVVASGPSLTW